MRDVIVIILNVVVILMISWQFLKVESSSIKRFFWPAFIFKISCGLALGLLYKYYYNSGDTFNLYNDATSLSGLARADWKIYVGFLWSGDDSFVVWKSLIYHDYRSLFFVKWISIFNILTFSNYWLTSLYFSLLSFLGSWYLTKKINEFFQESGTAVVFAFLFFPSVIFWSSGVSKEALAIPGLYFLAGIFLKAWHHQKLNFVEWILCLLATWCVWRLKYFYLALFLPIGFTTLLTKYLGDTLIKKVNPGFYILIWFTLFGMFVFMISFLHPNFSFSYLPEVIVLNNNEYTRLSRPDNLIRFPNLKPTFISIVQHSPKALFSGLFRPFVWEGNSLLKLLSAIENLTLFVLLTSALVRIKIKMGGRYKLITFAILMYCILLCIFLALSTPNLGTLARYRIGFLPFLVFVLTYRNPFLTSILNAIQRFYRGLGRKS